MHLDGIPYDVVTEYLARLFLGRAGLGEYVGVFNLAFVVRRSWKGHWRGWSQEGVNRNLLEGVQPRTSNTQTMFPLKERKVGGYRFKQRTFYLTEHLGVDYRADRAFLYAPCKGKVLATDKGIQGGNTILFQPLEDVRKTDGTLYSGRMRFMHLDRFLVSAGQDVQTGDLIGVTGNTGLLTTGPHLHLDLPRELGTKDWLKIGNFTDPETIDWDGTGSEPTVQEAPKPEPVRDESFVVRITGPQGANARDGATVTSRVFQFLSRGAEVSCKGTVTGQRVSANGRTSDQWFLTSRSGKYVSATVATRK